MSGQAERRATGDQRLLWIIPGAILGLFLLEMFLSLYVWQAWPGDLAMYKWHTFTGLFLWAVPVATVLEGELIWWPWQPFVWLAAWAGGVAVWWWGRGLHPANRWIYAGLMTLVLSGFGASEWSTIGD